MAVGEAEVTLLLAEGLRRAAGDGLLVELSVDQIV
eukprot:CAMPEP_0203931918 /NCGR_PEP_ID=MMETSP0359-20131031/70413_1 /ASSEMBLY_ACC=CAM_ASM_000338 /TAXON_ID=268821 /ORGANISM="Scrippsiella Hangoei, Strain SHTV-5" /LENGTH=34 /DNA_ID= /DNA_START= /DNA_END= /DNA_ORIENTATION=